MVMIAAVAIINYFTLVGIVIEEANDWGMAPSYALCIVSAESHWNPNAVGDNGDAVGLFQWHLESFYQIRREMGLPEIDLRADPRAATEAFMYAVMVDDLGAGGPLNGLPILQIGRMGPMNVRNGWIAGLRHLVWLRVGREGLAEVGRR
jgi:hypothetical protein